MCGNIRKVSERLPDSPVILARKLPTLKAGTGECRTTEAIWDILRAFGHVAPCTPRNATPNEQTEIYKRMERNPVSKV